MSEEEAEKEFLEEGFNLESPEADQKINFGTAAPNCQPKHTQQQEQQQELGQEVTHDESMSAKHRRGSSAEDGDDHRDKRQHLPEPEEPQGRKKLSYIQMAKLGYQELVNAIIRPPRADYKVSGSL